MKKHISVFMLFTGGAIFRLLAVLAAIAVSETAGYLLLHMKDDAGFGMNDSALIFTVIFGAAYIILSFLLMTLPGRASQCGYTLDRLRVSRAEVFVWQSVSNAVCLLILWLWQIAVLFLLAKLYERGTGLANGAQGIMIDFYRVPIFHSIFPLEDTVLWLRNIVFALSSGIACASVSQSLRSDRKPISAVVLFIIPIISFKVKLGASASAGPAFLMIDAAVAAYVVYASVSRRKREAQNEEA